MTADTEARRRGSHRKSRRPRASGRTGLVETARPVALRAIFRRFWSETKSVRIRLLLNFLIAMAIPVLDAAVVWLFMILIDDVLVPQYFELFPWIAAAYVAITVVHGLVSLAETYLSVWVSERFGMTLRTKLFDHVQRLSVGFLERRKVGDVMSRLSGDLDEIETLAITGVSTFMTYVMRVALYTGLLFYLSWKLALLAFLAAPIFALASRYFSRRI